MLLYEVINPKSWAIKASLQAGTYFDQGSQGALQNMLSYRARAKMSTVRNMKMMTRVISSPLSLTYQYFCVGFRDDAKDTSILKKFNARYFLTGIAALLIGFVPQSQPIWET